jgi:hypothetical protein
MMATSSTCRAYFFFLIVLGFAVAAQGSSSLRGANWDKDLPHQNATGSVTKSGGEPLIGDAFRETHDLNSSSTTNSSRNVASKVLNTSNETSAVASKPPPSQLAVHVNSSSVADSLENVNVSMTSIPVVPKLDDRSRHFGPMTCVAGWSSDCWGCGGKWTGDACCLRGYYTCTDGWSQSCRRSGGLWTGDKCCFQY